MKAYGSPVPACGGLLPVPGPVPAEPEIYKQNDGRPVVVYAYGGATNEVALPTEFEAPALPLAPALPVAPALPCAPALPPPALPLPLPLPLPPKAPCDSALPLPLPLPPKDVASDEADLAIAQQLADKSIAEAPVETIPAPDRPCKVETRTEVVKHPGETFVHQPGEIVINRPPTRLIINHEPYIVRPSPIVLNTGAKTITNAFTRKILPSSIQLRPVIVRIVRPIEKKVLIDKPGSQGCQTFESKPVIPDACATPLALDAVPAAAASAGLAFGEAPAALPFALPAPASLALPSAAAADFDYQSLLDSAVRIYNSIGF